MPESSQTVRVLGGIVSILLLALAAGCEADSAVAPAEAPGAPQAAFAAAGPSFPVAGTAIHFFTTAIVHSQQATGSGMVQRSTEVIRLDGDLRGYILYHPTSTFDFAAGTLVNTGDQVFSGTVAGSAPVVLHDDRYRFAVDLSTGETRGTVYLGRSGDAPHRGGWFECVLEVWGTGLTPEGDGMAEYTGTCTPRGNPV